MSWNDDIKKIMAIAPHVESLQKELSRPKKESYDDSQIRAEVENLGATVSELYDDMLSIKRSESSTRTSQELAENFERELLVVKSKLDKLKQVKPYDDRDLTKRLSKLEQINPQKDEMLQLIKRCEEQCATVNSLSKEYGKINELSNVIKERDKTIKDLRLGLRRAESSAKTCEELMMNMERRLDELSARLKNGN